MNFLDVKFRALYLVVLGLLGTFLLKDMYLQSSFDELLDIIMEWFSSFSPEFFCKL